MIPQVLAALRKLETLVRTSDIAEHPRAALEAEDCLSVLWKYVLTGSSHVGDAGVR